MNFESGKLYHIYNRSNETVFYSRDNYLFFLEKINNLIFPVCDILAWCLMPNHFHFLVRANNLSIATINKPHMNNYMVLSKNIGTLLSSYTQAINNQQHRKGKLFAHNTKAICLNDTKRNENYAINCFYYIHQNPHAANLVERLEDWEFSSFHAYANLRNGKFVNKNLAYEIINYDKDNFIQQSYNIIDDKKLKYIW
ncbi:MAG: transposase [Bacteroidetes bacterium]|nr:transposase [Bacteroidota bacterium]